MLGDLLGVLGYDVTTVGNADDAMKAVASFHPDVVLLDWHMPDFGRFEGLDYFRRNHAGLPVIVVSGDAAVDVAHDVRAHGAFDFIGKPFGVPQLQRIVAAAMDQRRG